MLQNYESVSSAWETDYQHHLRDLTLKRMRVMFLLSALVSVLNGSAVLVLAPALFRESFWVFGGGAALFALLFGLTYVGLARRSALTLSLIAAVLVLVVLDLIIVRADGYHSPGLSLLGIAVITWALLFPYSLLQAGIVCLLGWAAFLVPIIIGGRSTETGDSSFHIAVVFSALIGSSVVALGVSHMVSRLRRQEFFGQQALREEQAKSEQLLLNILPEPIAQRLKDKGEPISDGFSEVTILFADIVGFTPFSERLLPKDVVALLNDIFSRFDDLTEKHGLEKIKTIGDSYMAVSGLPMPNENHTEAVAEMALDMVEEIVNFNEQTGRSLDIRIGINSGSVVAGVIGKKKFIYDLWGDTVNTASRMESHGVAGRIQVTEATYDRLRENYRFEERGVISVKGKGEMRTYFLRGRR